MMFTGLVEEVGRIERVGRRTGGAAIRIAASLARELERGTSVAVNGVCLTVTEATTRSFEAEAVRRTMATTTLGRAAPGWSVNLERALQVGDELGGHLVTGHVDGVGRIVRIIRTGTGRDVTVELPRGLARHVAERGSIALDGMSLTVAEVRDARVTISLIPETLSRTIAGSYRVGTRVNVETDVLAKYLESLAHSSGEEPSEETLTVERLTKLGFARHQEWRKP